MNIFSGLLDVCFPPRPSAMLLRTQNEHTIRSLLHGGRHQNSIYLAVYQHPVIRAAVREHKFFNNRHATKLLATLCQDWFQSQDTDGLIIVPLPLSRTRERARGYNQVTSVLQQALRTELLRTDILTRHIDTIPQVELSKADRLKNVSEAFSCTQTGLPDTVKHVILVDDVITTGATMAAARAALVPHLPPGTKLTCLAFAH